MFGLIAELVTRRGWMVLLGWVALTAALYATSPSWETVSRDDDVRFFPPGSPSVIGQDLLEEGFPGDIAGSSVILLAERPGQALSGPDLAFLDRLENALKTLQREKPGLGIKKVYGRNEPVIGERLSARNKQGGELAIVGVPLKGTFIAKETRLAVNDIIDVLDRLKAQAPEGLNVHITGGATVGHDSNTAANTSIEATTSATIILVVVILLVVYRSPLLALIPITTIGLSAWTALMAIASMARPPFGFQVINITKIFVVVVLFGAGTDYCLFLIARYREELARGRGRADALGEAIRQVGGALVASAGTVILGLGMLWFSTFAKIKYTGPAIGVSLAIGLVASLTLAPVLLSMLRGAVFWPFKPPHHETGADTDQESLEETPMYGFWASVADFVVRHPAAILTASLLVLVPFAYFGLRSKVSYDILADLGPSEPSVQGARVFQSYYPKGELGPSTVLVRDRSVDFSSQKGRQLIASLSESLAKLPNVVEVRSLARPLGRPGQYAPPKPDEPKPPKSVAQGGFFGRISGTVRQGLENVRQQAIRRGILAHYVSTQPRDEADRNHITRLDVVFGTNPFSEESLESLDHVQGVLIEAVENGPMPEAEVGLAGSTVQIDDLKTVTTRDERRMYVLVTCGVYAILVVLLGRPGICLYLIATVVLGYLASLGITELVFRDLLHASDPWTGLDWKVGFFLFVILVAVGEDYNIFLMSRLIEEERKYGPVEGTRRAVAHTGGIISSCGVIMAGTFLSMLFGSLTTLQELGFALGLGVLLDTFVVRPVLVPAFVVLWHRWKPESQLDSPAVPHDTAEPAATPGL